MNESVSNLPQDILPCSRKARGIEIQNLAESLNVDVEIIQALEEGRYNDLFNEAFVCGLVRAYANELMIDSGLMIQAYKLSISADVKHDFSVTSRIFGGVSQRSLISYLLLPISILVVIFSWFLQQPGRVQPVMVGSEIAIDTALGATVVRSIDDMPVINPTQDFFSIATIPTVVIAKQSQSISGGGEIVDSTESALNFSFTADCWVMILDGDNKLIYSDLQHANQHLELLGKPPFKITLGHASGVELTYNNKPVVINADQANAAKFILGNS